MIHLQKKRLNQFKKKKNTYIYIYYEYCLCVPRAFASVGLFSRQAEELAFAAFDVVLGQGRGEAGPAAPGELRT